MSLHTIGNQVNGDACWPLTILVVTVIPNLVPFNLRFCRFVGVSDVVIFNSLDITGWRIFIDGVVNLLPVFEFIQISKAVLPIICGSNLLRLHPVPIC